MPLYDITSIIGGYDQSLVDWPLGDDRILSGDTQQSVNPPPPSDLSLSDAYFTLKLNPNDTDADAIFQLHITQTGSASGQIITGLGGARSNLVFYVVSGTYEVFVTVGPNYWWDVRCITSIRGATFTVATGTVQFLQNVTQTNKAGTPATAPNTGQPIFRGFRAYSPNVDSSNVGWSNTGDIFFNSNPTNGNGIGWQCYIEGNPGLWITLVNGVGSIADPHFKGYTGGEPGTTVGYILADYFLNSNPTSGDPEGWVLTALGWRSKGIIGDT
jgi:hypothetical protein